MDWLGWVLSLALAFLVCYWLVKIVSDVKRANRKD